MAPTKMKSFEQDTRYKFQMRMRPVADALYYKLIPGLISIERFDKEDGRHILDRKFAIDVKLTLVNGMVITMQEKFREWNSDLELKAKRQYRDITVEYQNDPIANTPGDWFNLSCQLYFEGYASKDEKIFCAYAFLDWLRVIIETQKGNITWGLGINTNGRAKANFKFTPIAQDWPECCILSKKVDKYCVPNVKSPILL